MKVHLGVAPDSWGVIFPKHEKQLPWKQTLDEMALAGYEGIELGPWGYFPNTVESLKPELEKRNLKLVAATVGADIGDYSSTDSMLSTIDSIVNLLKNFPTAKYIVLLQDAYTNLTTGECIRSKNLEGKSWEIFCKNINRIQEKVAQAGFVAAFHPHFGCCIETEAQIEKLLTDTNVDLCLDTGHHAYTGGDPISFFKKHHTRIPYLHFKNFNPKIKEQMLAENRGLLWAIANDIMCEPDVGCIDFVALKKVMEEVNYDGWATVEQDMFPAPPEKPLRVAKHTIDYLRKIGLG